MWTLLQGDPEQPRQQLKSNLMKCCVPAPGTLLRFHTGLIRKHVRFCGRRPGAPRVGGANPNILFIVRHKTMTLGFISGSSASARLFFLPRYFASLTNEVRRQKLPRFSAYNKVGCKRTSGDHTKGRRRAPPWTPDDDFCSNRRRDASPNQCDGCVMSLWETSCSLGVRIKLPPCLPPSLFAQFVKAALGDAPVHHHQDPTSPSRTPPSLC